MILLCRNAAVHTSLSTRKKLVYDKTERMAMNRQETRQASRLSQVSHPGGKWSSGHTPREWAYYLDTTCAEAVKKSRRWEARGWCEVAFADNGRVFLRVTQRGVAIGDRITGTTSLRLH